MEVNRLVPKVECSQEVYYTYTQRTDPCNRDAVYMLDGVSACADCAVYMMRSKVTVLQQKVDGQLDALEVLQKENERLRGLVTEPDHLVDTVVGKPRL